MLFSSRGVSKKINLEFYIDIHAHSTMMNGFMYGNIFEDEERFQRQAVFPKLLCQNAEDFSYISAVTIDFEIKYIFFLCIRNTAKLQDQLSALGIDADWSLSNKLEETCLVAASQMPGCSSLQTQLAWS
ncbi:hypothetical protein DUI87_14909 [Hirundo rustica rustica]|uniref:Peptidase M14 carboxypeptidase A domain-containing protein n=1 Tax=Hirundo rustica rustica TaxID=333673 RepID=A0A3M0K7U7_HIRRU|nr:hypothetical protein DUI87_14909 [Hirundo rustica rustica]